MRKLILGVATCAITLSSCSSNEVLDNNSESNLISFSTLNDKVTKAANADNSDYGVFADWSGGSSAWYMNNVEVTPGTPDTPDTYSPAAYWPTTTGTVSFYAYAPIAKSSSAIPGAPTVNSDNQYTTTKKLILDYTLPISITNQKDFTVATPVKDATSGPVALSFNHMLSKIVIGTIDLHADLKDAGFSIDLSNSSIRFITRVSGGTVDLLTFNQANDSWTTKLPETPTPKVEITTTYAGGSYPSFYIMPQPSWTEGKTGSASNCLFQLKNITINIAGAVYYKGDILIHAVGDGNITNAQSVLTDKTVNQFNRGSKYTLNITLGSGVKKPGQNVDDPNSGGDKIFANVIEFSSTVVNWDDETIAFTPGSN